MTAQHTPGPWAVNTAGKGDAKGRFVIDEIYVYAPESGADDVAVAADIADPLTGKPSEANARLIAAAPILLTELKRVREVIAAWNEAFIESVTTQSTGLIDNPDDVLTAEADQDLLNGIDAAIFKATGEQR